MNIILLFIFKINLSTPKINIHDAFLKLSPKFINENRQLINSTILATYHHLHAILLLCINYSKTSYLYDSPLSFKFEIFDQQEYGRCLHIINKMVCFTYDNNIKLKPIIVPVDALKLFFDSIHPDSKIPRNFLYEVQLITSSSVLLTEFLLKTIKNITNSLDRLILSQFILTIFSTPSKLCFFYLVRALVYIKKNYFFNSESDKILELFRCIQPTYKENLLVTEIKYFIGRINNSEKKMSDFQKICNLLGFVFPFIIRNIILMEKYQITRIDELNFVYITMTDIVYKVIQ